MYSKMVNQNSTFMSPELHIKTVKNAWKRNQCKYILTNEEKELSNATRD